MTSLGGMATLAMTHARGAGIPGIFAGWGYGAPHMALDNPVAADVAAVHALLHSI